MKSIWGILFTACAAWGADLTLWTTGSQLLPNADRWEATDQATKIFAAIGVSLEWKAAPPINPTGSVSIQVKFTDDAPGHPGALAFATPFDPSREVTVLYGRIRSASERLPESRPSLLAYVLVHEIGHLLMRTEAHTPQGIMKARWSLDDLVKMRTRKLSFLPADAERIRRGLDLSKFSFVAE